MYKICTRCKRDYIPEKLKKYGLCESCFEQKLFFMLPDDIVNLNNSVDVDRVLEFIKSIDLDLDTFEGIYLYKHEIKERKKYYIYEIF